MKSKHHFKNPRSEDLISFERPQADRKLNCPLQTAQVYPYQDSWVPILLSKDKASALSERMHQKEVQEHFFPVNDSKTVLKAPMP